MVDYEKVRKVAIVCHFIGAGLLFLTSILRFVSFNFTSTEFILSIYYILFGAIIILTELGYQRILEQFYFLNFSFGKAGFSLFIATLLFNLSNWFQILVSIFFLVAGLGFLIIGCFFMSEEREKAVPKQVSSSAPQIDNKLPVGNDAQKDAEKPKEIEMVNVHGNNQLPAPQV